MRLFGESAYSPFEVTHTSSELSALAKRLKSLDGEIRAVMEATGNYHFAHCYGTPWVGDLCFSSQYNTGAWLRKRHIAANHDRQAGCHKAGKRWPWPLAQAPQGFSLKRKPECCKKTATGSTDSISRCKPCWEIIWSHYWTPFSRAQTASSPAPLRRRQRKVGGLH